MYDAPDYASSEPSADRIRLRTSDASNRRIDHRTQGAIDEAMSSPAALMARLRKLDREWTVDRAVMLNFGIAGAVSALLAMRELRRTRRVGPFGVLFAAQLGFLITHAVRGWSPPLPILRRLGFRSGQEIAEERVALHRASAAMAPAMFVVATDLEDLR